MYGLIGGPFPYGLYYSAGLDVLADKLRSIGSHVEVLPTFGWSEWRNIVRDMKKQPADAKIILAGHSMGANQLTAITNALPAREVALIAAFDPTVWFPIQPIGSNVKQALWFRSTSFLSPAGHGRLKTGTDFSGRMERFDSTDRHENIDDNSDFHEIVVRAVCRLRD